jgi:hypothetical protein
LLEADFTLLSLGFGEEDCVVFALDCPEDDALDEGLLLAVAGLAWVVLVLEDGAGEDCGTYFDMFIDEILLLPVTPEVIRKFSEVALPSLCTMVCLAVNTMS